MIYTKIFSGSVVSQLEKTINIWLEDLQEKAYTSVQRTNKGGMFRIIKINQSADANGGLIISIFYEYY